MKLDKKNKPTAAEIEKARQARRAMQWLSSSIGGWTLSNVEHAIRQMMTGQFREAAKLAGYMYSTSPLVKAVVDKRVASLMGAEIVVDTASKTADSYGTNAVSTHVAGLVKEWIDSGCDRSEIKLWVRQFVMLGISPMHATWDTVSGWWLPTPEYISMEGVYYQQHSDQFTVQLRSGTEVIHPGDGNWILANDWQYGEAAGLVGSIAVLWWIGQATSRAFLDGNKSHINPKVLLKQVSDIGGMSGDDISDALDELNSTLVEGGVGYVKAGYDVSPINIGTYNSNSFDSLLAYVDRRITIAALGSNLSTEMASGGSYAAAVTHDGVERRITIADADTISSALNSQLVPYIGWLNFPSVNHDGPMLWFDVEDRSRQSDRLEQYSAIKELIGEQRWNEQIDCDQLLSEFNIPIKK